MLQNDQKLGKIENIVYSSFSELQGYLLKILINIFFCHHKI